MISVINAHIKGVNKSPNQYIFNKTKARKEFCVDNMIFFLGFYYLNSVTVHTPEHFGGKLVYGGLKSFN